MPVAVPDAKYRTNGQYNHILLAALLQANNKRCYWCTEAKKVKEMNIDHIVPRKLKGKKLVDALRDLKLPADYDRNDPRNLAAICASPCNREKSNAFFADAPRFLSALGAADGRRDEVIRLHDAYFKSANVTDQLIKVAEADVRDEDVCAAMELYGQDTIQKLRDAAGLDYLTRQVGQLILQNGEIVGLETQLFDGGRAVLAALLVVLGKGPNGNLDELSPHLDGSFNSLHESALEAANWKLSFNQQGRVSEPDFADLRTRQLTFAVSHIALQRKSALLDFYFSGEIDGLYEASVTLQEETGGSTDDKMVDLHLTGDFHFNLEVDPVKQSATHHNGNLMAIESEIW